MSLCHPVSCGTVYIYTYHFEIYMVKNTDFFGILPHTATHCNTLQHTATHGSFRNTATLFVTDRFGIPQGVTRWLRLVGSTKLQVSFAEYSLFSWALLQKETLKRDDVLQKRPIILRSLLIVATPYLVALVCVLQYSLLE